MSNNTSIIKLMALKMGLMQDTKVLRKAEEYERLTDLHLNQANNINSTAKPFLCLDLAASACGSSFDLNLAIKLSGLNKSTYVKTKHMLEKLLNKESLTIKNFCITNECIDAVTLAEKIMKKYQECDIKDTDTLHPQYITMAVYQSCMLQKIKVPKAKFLNASNLKSSQWTRLEEEWTRFVNKYFGDFKQLKRTGKKTDTDINEWIKEIEKDTDDLKVISKTEDKTEVEEYTVWKCRILKQAHKELKEKKSQKNNSSLLTNRQLF